MERIKEGMVIISHYVENINKEIDIIKTTQWK